MVIGNLAMLMPGEGVDKEILEDAKKAAHNGSELVKNLLAFSRRQSLEPVASKLDGLLNDFRRSLGRALGESIVLEVSVPDDPLAAFIDRSQFEAALINLCINARDAMPGGGTIRLNAFPSRANEGEQPLIPDGGSDADDFICVQVCDDGSGIDAELLSKVVEPYFTTKAMGEGSGLGLSSVVGFVDQSGGSMRIFSEPGVGTTVELFLPRCVSPETEASDSETNRTIVFSPGRDQFNVLVVDDEPDVRRLAARWLERSGYNVLQASSGEDALKTIEERGGRVDVLFSDIVMPGDIDGWALAEQVSSLYPRIGIQLATGYDQGRTQGRGSDDKQRFPVLFKPYNLSDLSNAVEGIVRLAEEGRTLDA